MKIQTKDHSQELELTAKALLKNQILAQEWDQREASTKIAQEIFQTAMELMVFQELTAAEIHRLIWHSEWSI
jgi:hypothetical protein